MDPRDLLLNNLRWKMTALALAAFTWLSIHWKGSSNEITFRKEVQVLLAPGDTRAFELGQPRVDVTVRAGALKIDAFSKDDIQVFVDMTDAPRGLRVSRRLQAHGPEGTKIIRIVPSRTYVEEINPLQESFTNSITIP